MLCCFQLLGIFMLALLVGVLLGTLKACQRERVVLDLTHPCDISYHQMPGQCTHAVTCHHFIRFHLCMSMMPP